MIVGNRSKEKHIYTGEWISVEDRKKRKLFNFAITNNPNEIEVTYNNVDGITGDLFVKTYSQIPFSIDDIVIWKGYGEGKRYNIVQVTDGVDNNELAHLAVRKSANLVRYIQLRRAG